MSFWKDAFTKELEENTIFAGEIVANKISTNSSPPSVDEAKWDTYQPSEEITDEDREQQISEAQAAAAELRRLAEERYTKDHPVWDFRPDFVPEYATVEIFDVNGHVELVWSWNGKKYRRVLREYYLHTDEKYDVCSDENQDPLFTIQVSTIRERPMSIADRADNFRGTYRQFVQVCENDPILNVTFEYEEDFQNGVHTIHNPITDESYIIQGHDLDRRINQWGVYK